MDCDAISQKRELQESFFKLNQLNMNGYKMEEHIQVESSIFY